MDLLEARALHDEVPVMDLHADTPKLMDRLGFDIAARHDRTLPRPLNVAGHIDLPRAREGGLGAQIFGLWTFPYPNRGCAASIDRQIDAVERAIVANPDQLTLAGLPHDIRAAQRDGRFAAMLGIEGGHALEGELANVERFARRRVRYIGLMHFSRNRLGSPAYGRGANPGQGLTGFGRDVVREMNRLGVVVDLAHINRKGFFEVLELTQAPPIVSHTGVCGVHDMWRNIDDEQLRALADKGGCAGIIFSTKFLGGTDLDALCDHILHVVDAAGEDVPALGSDFDGFVIPPDGLEDVRGLPRLTAALSRRGLSRGQLLKVLGENALRVLGDVPPIYA